MAVRLQCVNVDANDPQSLARWWAEVLGWRITDDDPDEVVVEPPEGEVHRPSGQPDLLFARVPEGKAGKNRLHFDLRPDDQAAEVARIEGMGARRVDVGQGPDVSWIVFADPEGNEFCVLRALRPDEL